MNRRRAVQAIGSGLVSIAAAPAPAQAPWKPAVLSEHQNATVDALSELILPRTDTPGARDAQVNRYIDGMLKEGVEAADRDLFLRGLEWLDRHCRQHHGKPFVELPGGVQTAVLTALSERRKSADAEGQAFFRKMKDFTIRGYYTSPAGLQQELEYKGNQAQQDYPGCTHPEHKA